MTTSDTWWAIVSTSTAQFILFNVLIDLTGLPSDMMSIYRSQGAKYASASLPREMIDDLLYALGIFLWVFPLSLPSTISIIVKWGDSARWGDFVHLRHSLESNNISPKICTEYRPNFLTFVYDVYRMRMPHHIFFSNSGRFPVGRVKAGQ